MPTTRKTDVVVDTEAVEQTAVSVSDPVLTVPGDEPPLAVSDPREAALAALLAAPATTVSDLAPPPPGLRVPLPSGTVHRWFAHGDPYLVRCPIYPRVVGDGDAQRARAGDVVMVPDDDRTHEDLARGYLIRQ